MYEVTVVHGAGKGRLCGRAGEIIVMIALGRKKSMQYVLHEAQDWHSHRQCHSVCSNRPNLCYACVHVRRALRQHFQITHLTSNKIPFILRFLYNQVESNCLTNSTRSSRVERIVST